MYIYYYSVDVIENAKKNCNLLFKNNSCFISRDEFYASFNEYLML